MDSFMEDEGKISNISGSFHLADDSRDHNEYRASDVTYNMSANQNDTLHRGIVLPRIPFGTSMAEMERIGREELDAIRNNTARNQSLCLSAKSTTQLLGVQMQIHSLPC